LIGVILGVFSVSEQPAKPITHHVLAATSIKVAPVTLQAAVLRVNRPEELAPALAQREKTVVIENDAMQRRFAAFAQWQQAARWWLIPILIAWLLNQAIVRDYKIDASWRYIWKVEQTFEGKVTLTPTDPRASQREKPLPPEFPD
jgi:hypothetical protein